ncbi:LysR family transcriptional regulator [Pantoea sp. 1.19]|uniref:LysR family transcriptional regulator n=1 Tax=Pantoea sp. 1.19 TaxID=1925589 RepID=UPI0009491B3C|nr:LysR family transcriptional regulator [Pantoea sp. 1.19]
MIDSEITLRKMEIFQIFMQEETIARTAERLGISSVSVHRALHSLEAGLRCPLFVHTGRVLRPLPAAQTLLASVTQLLSLTDRAIESTRRAAGVGQPRMTIGTLFSLTLDTLPLLMKGLNARRPGTDIALQMGSNQQLLALLTQQALDAILIALPEAGRLDPALETVTLFDDHLWLAVPTASALPGGEPADLRDYRQQRFVSLTAGFTTQQGFCAAFQRAGFTPQIVTEVSDIFSLLSLVQAGVGLTLIPGRMRRIYQQTLRLVPLCAAYQQRQRLALVFNRNRERDPNLLALTAECRMLARHHRPSPA